MARGGALDAAAWAARHRGISLWLWVHVLAIPVIAVVRGETALVALVAAGAVAPFALGAEVTGWSVTVRTASATLGLLVSTAVLAYLFDGAIEAHFHFFVVVSAVALHQTWLSFLLALAFVLLHHGVVGTLAPAATYNHAAAIANPWLWGALHAGAILGRSIACLGYWHANEQAALRERQVLVVAEKSHRDLVEPEAVRDRELGVGRPE